MRTDNEDSANFNTRWKSGKFSHSQKVLTGPVTITKNGSIVNVFDAGGVDRVVTLPPYEAGRFYVVANIGTAGNLTINDALGVTKATIVVGGSSLLFASDSNWIGVSASLDLEVFGYTGPSHSTGLVPDPGPGPVGSPMRFLSELGWSTVAGLAASNAYFYTWKGGAVTLTPVGAEAIELTSANAAIAILANAGTTPKSIRFTLDQTQIDHNLLLNYSTDRHVGHSLVVLTAGLGLSGGGNIVTSRTFDFAPSELAVVPLSGLDYFVVDIAAGGPRRSLISSINTIINHDTLAGYVANRHIDHSVVSIVASTGLTGGGNLLSSRSLAVSIPSLNAGTPVGVDEFMYVSQSTGEHLRAPVSLVLGGGSGGGIPEAPTDGTIYGRRNAAWTAVPSGGGGTVVSISDTPPASPTVGQLWWESDTGRLYIRYNDGTSTQWVQVAA